MTEQIETRSKKVRGMAKASLDLIESMRAVAETTQPITGRGIGYKLFTAGLIPSMGSSDMQRVYRLLGEARERGVIPWHWIVDETRSLEIAATWEDPDEFVDQISRAYRRDYWSHQPMRVEVWSENGTVRGVIKPVLNRLGVGFQVMHGFSSKTTVRSAAVAKDGRPLIILYVGDYDPSGLFMSRVDLPKRLAQYGGDHVVLARIALRPDQLSDLPSFPASDKSKDPRHKWFVQNYGSRCWELDAMDPNDLRACVEEEVEALIEREAWDRCAVTERAEINSLKPVLDKWASCKGHPA